MCLDYNKINELPDNAMLKVKPELYYEWDFEMNINLDIWKITKGSHEKINWKCVKCGSSYDMIVYNKIKGNICSYCSNKKVNHTNCMASTHPHLLEEWDFSKNKDITPYNITHGSKKIAWWKCSNCDSLYQCALYHRSGGKGCPYCSGQKVNHTNCLANVNKKLSLEWDYEKNDLTPNDVTVGTTKKVWWKCELNHSYQSSPSNRSNGRGCPYCVGKKVNNDNCLATKNPKLASQWHPTKNGNLTPRDVTCGTNQKVWWLGECGHEWEASISSRKGNVGCPYCSNKKVLKGFNDISTTNPELLHLLVNPDDAYNHIAGGFKVLKWQCPNCKAIQDKRCSTVSYHGFRCRQCSDGVSYPHKFIRNILKSLNIEFKQEIEFNWSDGRIYDFYIPSLSMIIEVHGRQHYEECTRGRSLKEEQENDAYKRELASKNNIVNYAELDCRESNPEWIKKSICSSILPEFINLNSIDWKMIGVKSERSLVIECWRLYNEGKDSKDIYEELNISRITYNKYIKNGKHLGLLEERNPNVAILELDCEMNILQEFDNHSRYYKDNNKKGQILRVLKGQRNHYRGLRYMYKEDYDKLIVEQN